MKGKRGGVKEKKNFIMNKLKITSSNEKKNKMNTKKISSTDPIDEVTNLILRKLGF